MVLLQKEKSSSASAFAIRGSPTTSSPSRSSSSGAKGDLVCEFCERRGHNMASPCYSYQRSRERAIKEAKERKTGGGGQGHGRGGFQGGRPNAYQARRDDVKHDSELMTE